MTKSASKVIVDAAKTEINLKNQLPNRHKVQGNRVKSRARNEQKNVPVSVYYKKVVRLSELPVIIDKNTGFFPKDTRVTNGWFSITYNPEGSPKRVKNKPYTIGQDLVAGRFCVSSLKHWQALCERIPEFAFLVKWSNYDSRLFRVAKQHPGVAFCFNFNWGAYAEMIDKKAEEMGVDIDHKPFFAYIAKKEVMDEMHEKYKMYPNPTKDDYISVLEEVDENGHK